MTKALTCTFCSPFIIARAVKQSYVAIAGLNEKLNAANSLAYTPVVKETLRERKNQF